MYTYRLYLSLLYKVTIVASHFLSCHGSFSNIYFSNSREADLSGKLNHRYSI